MVEVTDDDAEAYIIFSQLLMSAPFSAFIRLLLFTSSKLIYKEPKPNSHLQYVVNLLLDFNQNKNHFEAKQTNFRLK